MYSVLREYCDENKAIKHAKKLNEHYDENFGEDRDFVKQNPNTRVHLLVEALNKHRKA